MAFGGCWISVPGGLPMLLQLAGDTSADGAIFQAIYNALVYLCPVAGTVMIAWEWCKTSSAVPAQEVQ